MIKTLNKINNNTILKREINIACIYVGLKYII